MNDKHMNDIENSIVILASINKLSDKDTRNVFAELNKLNELIKLNQFKALYMESSPALRKQIVDYINWFTSGPTTITTTP